MRRDQIKVINIDNDSLIRMCELNIGVRELSKDIDLNNMWGMTFEQLSDIERETNGLKANPTNKYQI